VAHREYTRIDIELTSIDEHRAHANGSASLDIPTEIIPSLLTAW
jgi:hypothetical protein